MIYKISDSVSMRMIQIFQEAVIFGIDGADLLRQVRLVEDPNEEGTLVLSQDYAKAVAEMYEKSLADISKKQSLSDTITAFNNDPINL